MTKEKVETEQVVETEQDQSNVIARLQRELDEMKAMVKKILVFPSGSVSVMLPDFIKHGSDQHAAILGLRKATPEDAYDRDGWTLVDVTAFGPQASEAYIKEVLRQKVTTLKAGPPPIPPKSPPLWNPEAINPTPEQAERA